MKKLLIILFTLLPIYTYANIFIQQEIDNHIIRATIYDKNNKNHNIKIIKSKEGINFKDMLQDNNGISGINGVFFCPKDYLECKGETFTINERYIKGEKFGKWDSTGDRVVFGWDEEENTFLYQTNGINKDKENEIFYGFANHPLLLRGGKAVTIEYWDKGLIANNMRIKGTRNFICDNKENNKIIFGTISNATIDEAAIGLLKFGCFNALNLDAGGSLSYVYNSRQIAGPGRKVLDGVMIEVKGINVGDIKKASNKLSRQLLSMINKGNINMQITNLNKLINKLIDYRTKIYSNYSTDILDENGEKIGYKLEINDINTLKIINIINQSQDDLLQIRNILIRYSQINSSNNLGVDFNINFK